MSSFLVIGSTRVYLLVNSTYLSSAIYFLDASNVYFPADCLFCDGIRIVRKIPSILQKEIHLGCSIIHVRKTAGT
jgi:hypothetical protein